jgi:Ubiquitin carboxyl-terminal hydrolase
MIRNWAVQYTEVTWWPWDTPLKRARTRTIFAKGRPGPYDSWDENHRMHGQLHLSLLLFIIGALIYLFNINRVVFYAVVGWLGFRAIEYSILSVAAFSHRHIVFHTPLSLLGLRTYLVISYVVIQVCSYIPPLHGLRDTTKRRYHDLSNRYSDGILQGKRKEAEEIASKPSSEIDSLMLERILLSLDEDTALETFFDSLPGFCNSNLTVLPLSFPVPTRLRQSLDGFLNRTFSSNLVSESVRANRLIICLNAAHAALGPSAVSGILDNAFNGHWDEALQSVEIGHALRLWSHRWDHDQNVQRIIASIITRARKRDDGWTTLVKEEFGVLDDVLRDSFAHGDSVLLSILIHTSRQANHASSWTLEILSSLSKFDIHNTLPGLQHEFCALWNEIAEEARSRGLFSTSVKIILEIRHLYIALHQDADAAPTAFSVLTDDSHQAMFPSSYPFCNITSHRPPSAAHIPANISRTVPFPTQPGGFSYVPPHRSTPGDSTTLRLAKETNIIAGWTLPSDQTAASEFGESSQALTATESALPVYNAPVITDAPLPSAVAAALKGNQSTATLSHPLEGNDLQGIVPPYAERDINEISSTRSRPTPILVPLPVSAPSVLDKLLTSLDVAPTSTSNSLLPADPTPSVVGFAISGSRPPPQAQISNLVALPSGTTSYQINSDTLPRLRARGLVNSENNCFANAVLQLLVHCPPFFSLFRDRGRLMGQQGPGQGLETGGATPLADAMVKLLDEFVYKEERFVTQRPQQNPEKGEERRNEEGKKEHDVAGSFNPRYMYDAMKEKRQLKPLLVCSRNQDAPFCY